MYYSLKLSVYVAHSENVKGGSEFRSTHACTEIQNGMIVRG
jgi:hypothetical protein